MGNATQPANVSGIRGGHIAGLRNVIAIPRRDKDGWPVGVETLTSTGSAIQQRHITQDQIIQNYAAKIAGNSSPGFRNSSVQKGYERVWRWTVVWLI
jgi:hypothetical protein